MSTLVLYLVVFGILFAIGSPVVLSLAAAAVVMLLTNGVDLLVFAQKFIVSMDNYSLVAMLFFILAGEIMNGGGMTRRIVAAVSRLLKNLPGGLAIVSLVSCAFFAAINGSAIATPMAIGAIMYPAMVEQGYPPAFAAATIVAGGIVGPIIPPSIPMIVYGSSTGDSIAALFAGGALLGVLIIVLDCLAAYWISKKHGYGTKVSQIDFGSTKGIGWALAFPLLILVSILGGFMTATETSALAVVYAWFVGTFIYKEFKFKEFPEMMARSMKSSAAPTMASTGQAWMHSVQPIHVSSSMIATCFGFSSALSGLTSRPSRSASLRTPSCPPGGHRLMSTSPSAMASA